MQADSAQQQGLYRPEFDHDACGIGALADINGERHHQILDDALLRPGRFDKSIMIGPPDEASREAIFGIHTKNKPMAEDVSLSDLAAKTDGCTGADIAAICNEAVMNAVRNLIAKGGEPSDEDIGNCKVTNEDFDQALEKFGPRKRAELSEYGAE